jgi:hypothetical protein
MKRFRWALVLLTGMALVGAGAAAVLARSTATYTNHAIPASTFTSNGDNGAKPGQLGVWYWLSYGKTATWTFDASEFQAALNGSVSLNFVGLSTSIHWGSGYSTDMKVVVTGTGKGTFTQTLANPWRPHVAYNATPGIGWQAYASLNLPRYIWAGASSLKVTVTSITSNTYMGMNQGALLIGYATTP